MSGTRRGSGAVVLAVALALSLAVAAPAGAASVVNGDFEAGNLGGWTVSKSNDDGSWYAYSGTDSPFDKESSFTPELPEEVIAFREVPPPPQGTFAALADQGGPGTRILYQDLALEPGASHNFSMTVYYDSNSPIAVPSPDSLDVEPGGPGESTANQQYRVEVIKPSAPLNTVNPEDILAAIFRTNTGDLRELGPTTVSADLSALAGQTVRLRLTEVDNQGNFAAGADGVSLTTVPFNTFSFGKLKLNRKKGTGRLIVTVPGPGRLVLDDVRRKAANNKLKRAMRTAAAPGRVVLPVKPSRRGRKALAEKLKLAFRAQVTFTPTGGTPGIQSYGGKLKLKLPKPKSRR